MATSLVALTLLAAPAGGTPTAANAPATKAVTSPDSIYTPAQGIDGAVREACGFGKKAGKKKSRCARTPGHQK